MARQKPYLWSCLAVLPALSASHALAQDQDRNAIFFGDSAGIMALTLPNLSSGVSNSGQLGIADIGGQTAVGPMLGLDLGTTIGKLGDLDIVGNLSFLIGVMRATSSSTTALSGPGLITLSSNTPSTATIALTTSSNGAGATANTNVASNGIVIIQNSASGPGGSSTTYAVTQTADGAIYAGASTNGLTQSAAAFGAAADATGFTFVGVGDLTGVSLNTTSLRSVAYLGADGSIGLSSPMTTPTSFTPYVSLGWRQIKQDFETSTTFTLPGSTLPPIGLRRNELLDANYVGGGLGLNVTQRMDNQLTFNAGLEAGLRRYDFTFTGRDSAIFPVTGGAPAANVPVGGTSQSAQGTSWFAKGEAGVTFPVARNLLLGLNGSAEYISTVPTISRSGTDVQVTQAGDDATLTYPAGAASSKSWMAFTDAWSFGLKATLSGSF